MLFKKEAQQLLPQVAPAVYQLTVRKPNGDERAGSCFHVGEGVLVTAGHVLKGSSVLKVSRDKTTADGAPNEYLPEHIQGPFFPPTGSSDVAILKVTHGVVPPVVSLGRRSYAAALLDDLLLLGYPPIPLTPSPVLIAASAEINAGSTTYVSGDLHLRFIVSAMARGGFSGGLALHVKHRTALGVITESLVRDDQAPELGFFTVLAVEAIVECLAHHGLLSKQTREFWDDGET